MCHFYEIHIFYKKTQVLQGNTCLFLLYLTMDKIQFFVLLGEQSNYWRAEYCKCKAKGKYIQAAKDVIIYEIEAWSRYVIVLNG